MAEKKERIATMRKTQLISQDGLAALDYVGVYVSKKNDGTWSIYAIVPGSSKSLEIGTYRSKEKCVALVREVATHVGYAKPVIEMPKDIY